jgi:Phosphoesterase family
VSNVDRRTFLALLGIPAVAAALPQDLDKALAIPANNRSGTIDDVEHVVFLMQKNRSFDHYFGTLRGVRGFADPHPVTLPSGRSVWHQPNGSADLLPFRPEVRDLGRTFLPDPPHGWNDTHAAGRQGQDRHRHLQPRPRPRRAAARLPRGCAARPAAAGVLDRRARGLQRAPELGAGLRGLVRLAGRRHPRLQPRGLEQDGAVRDLRRGGRVLRSPGAADATADACAGPVDRADDQRDLPW